MYIVVVVVVVVVTYIYYNIYVFSFQFCRSKYSIIQWYTVLYNTAYIFKCNFSTND